MTPEAERLGVADPSIARRIEAMAGYGVSPEDIATAMGLDVDALRRTYHDELKGAAIKANARVAESLFRKAIGDGREGVIAAIFWMKTRAGWRETSIHEVTDSRPYRNMTPEQIEARIRVLLKRHQPTDLTTEAESIGGPDA
jgi:hypothetical protein